MWRPGALARPRSARPRWAALACAAALWACGEAAPGAPAEDVGDVDAPEAGSDGPRQDTAAEALGATPDHPAKSCHELLAARPDAPSGAYFVRDARTGLPASVWCDRDIAVGGWLRCAELSWRAGEPATLRGPAGEALATAPAAWGLALGWGGAEALAEVCLGGADGAVGLAVRVQRGDAPPLTMAWRPPGALPAPPLLLRRSGQAQYPCADRAPVTAEFVGAGAAGATTLLLDRRALPGPCGAAAATGLALLDDASGQALWSLTDTAAAGLLGADLTPAAARLEVFALSGGFESPAPRPPRSDAPFALASLPVTPCEVDPAAPPFRDVTAALGIPFEAPWVSEPVPFDSRRDRHVGGGAAVADFNGDGQADIALTATWGAPALYLSDGTGGYVRQPSPAFEPLRHTVAAYPVDLDGDGDHDLVLTSWEGVRGFLNNGAGGFSVLPALWTAAADERPTFQAWTDYDADGWLDLYLGVGPLCFRDPDGAPCPAFDQLLHGTGPRSFEPASPRLQPKKARGGLALGGGWLDIDGDGDLDVMVANDGGNYAVPNTVFLNPGPGDGPFVESAGTFALDEGMAGMGVAFGDPLRTGALEIAVSNIHHVKLFTRPTGTTSFDKREVEPDYTGLTLVPGYPPAVWAVELEDLDNDGDLDLLTSFSWLFSVTWWDYSELEEDLLAIGLEPLASRLWLREGGALVERSALIAPAAPSWTWRAAVPIDLDHDGALDLVFASQMGPVSVQLGRCPERRWLSVALQQPGGNRDALGARVELTSALGAQWRRVGIGSTGSLSGREPRVHFGLADDDAATLRVLWPDGAVSEIGEVPARRRVVVRRL